MNRKAALIVPLLLAVTMTIIVTPAAAEPPHGTSFIGGKGFARVGMFDYVCGEAIFSYCFTWDYAVLIFEMDGKISLLEGVTGVWEIVDCTVRRYECFETFRGEWVPSTLDQKTTLENENNDLKLIFDNDLCCGDIRVITFLKNGERSFVIVYGFGVFFVGCEPVYVAFGD